MKIALCLIAFSLFVAVVQSSQACDTVLDCMDMKCGEEYPLACVDGKCMCSGCEECGPDEEIDEPGYEGRK